MGATSCGTPLFFYLGTDMALSDIELVYAEAVDLIGEIELNESSDQQTKPYSTCVKHYDNARDEMIRGYAWNEASDYALALETTQKPLHTWAFRFSIPSDTLRILHTTRPKLKWRVLSGFLYTDYKIEPDTYTVGTDYYAGRYITRESITYLINVSFTATEWGVDSTFCTSQNGDYGLIELEYIKKLPDPNDWSVDLRRAVTLNLAAKIVVPITSDQERRTKILEELHQLVLPHSFAIDAMTGTPQQFFFSDYLDSRGQI